MHNESNYWTNTPSSNYSSNPMGLNTQGIPGNWMNTDLINVRLHNKANPPM